MIRFDGENIKLDTNDPEQNYVQVDSCDFRLEYLNDSESNKGASSNLFLLIDPEEEFEDRVIKICKTPLGDGKNKRIARFEREISAFRLAKSKKLRNVIQYLSLIKTQEHASHLMESHFLRFLSCTFILFMVFNLVGYPIILFCEPSLGFTAS